jgi:hypothetical protein
MTHRSDGLNNPLSINSGIGCTWAAVEDACERSDAVALYETTEAGFVIDWCDGTSETYSDPQEALIAIREMSRS